jgi:hypothetical protein
MTTKTENLKALQELATLYGLKVTILEKESDTQVTPKTRHSNAGKSYRTKKKILAELAEVKKIQQEAVKNREQAIKVIKQYEIKINAFDREIESALPKIKTLSAEALKKGATVKEIESARVKRAYRIAQTPNKKTENNG